MSNAAFGLWRASHSAHFTSGRKLLYPLSYLALREKAFRHSLLNPPQFCSAEAGRLGSVCL